MVDAPRRPEPLEDLVRTLHEIIGQPLKSLWRLS